VSAEDVERTISVDETAATTSVDHDFTTFGSASGSVVLNDDDVAGATGNDGNAVGASVTISKSGYTQSTTVDGDGLWSLTDVPQGSGYTITFANTGYVTETLTAQTIGSTNLAVAARSLDKLSSVTVDIVDHSAAALSATTIGLYAADHTTRIVTYAGAATVDASGTTATFTGLTPGTTVYAIATKSGYLQVADFSRTLDAGANTAGEAITLTLPATGTVTLTTDGLAGGSDATQVTFSWTRFGTLESIVTATINSDGETPISVTGLPATLTITIAHQDTTDTCSIDGTKSITTSTFTLTGGQTRTLELDCS
jgi:hypothetical protein